MSCCLANKVEGEFLVEAYKARPQLEAAYLSSPPSTCFPDARSELPPEAIIKHVLPYLLAFVLPGRKTFPASLAYEIPAILQGPAGFCRVY